MSHPIIEGPVKILKIVTPGAYWVRCQACEGSSRVPSSIKHKPHPNDFYYPQQGASVFARDDDGFFYRGTVCGRRVLPGSDYWKYVVQLTDTFQVKDFHQDDVYPSYGASSAASGSAHLVSLYHVLPRVPPAAYGKCLKIDPAERQAFEDSVVHWAQSVASMAHLTGGRVRFSFVQCKRLNGSIYGNISVSPPLQTVTGAVCHDLSDYLNFQKLAARMTFRFEHVVKALMTNPLIDSTELLATFDPFADAVFKPKPAPSVEKPPQPIEPDFTGFSVHPHDVALHQSLVQEFHINVIYTGTPSKHERILRFLTPDGHVVLGTVLNIELKYAEELETPLFSDYAGYRVKKSLATSKLSGDHPEMYYPDKMFEKLPPESDKPGNPLLSYNFDESRSTFRAAGGVFKEQFLPYPYSTAVEELIINRFDFLGVENLHEWQKLCLPALSCRKNLLVIGSKSTGKLTTSTISAISWMSYVNDSKSDSIHPQLVMFFRDFERADRTASFCAQLTGFRIIMSTSSYISQKQKEMAASGCDILITTPSNWAELVSQKVFDYSRLNHVIFDEFDRLHEMYADDLASILQILGACDRRIQTVIIANGWGSLIGDRRVQDKVEFPTVCITGVILACGYYGLTPTAVFVENDDWMTQFGDILSATRAKRHSAKTLLICHDEKEGKSIIERMPGNEQVRFVHGNVRIEAAFKMAKDWDRSHGEILVCTDDWIEQLDFLRSVDVLISWMTSSWRALSGRFMAFSHSLGSSKDLSWASAYLFCDCGKLEELSLVKSISYNLGFVNGTLDEHLAEASIQAEHLKPTNLCPFVLMFGKCSEFPTCPLRHVFLPGDDLKVPCVRQFLNVEILRVHSAFRYSVRVREIVSNYDPKANKNSYSLISKLEEIVHELVKCCSKTLTQNTLKIGQMVGACISQEGDPLLRRVTVKSIPENASCDLSLSVVDFEEPDVCLPLSRLFELSEDAARYPKDVVDLYITGLVPADIRSDWQHDTYNYMSSALEQMVGESNFLAGKVEMIVADRSVLVDSLYCYSDSGPFQKTMVSIIESEFCSVKDLILESGYCVRNGSHLSSLSELLVRGATCNGALELLDPEGSYGCRVDLPSHPVPAVVSSYDDPGLLYVQLADESERLADFEAALSATLASSRQKLHLIAMEELCAVWHNGAWNRAIIFDIIADLANPLGSIHVLFVDHGDTLLDARPQELHCLPEGFATVPFFAVQCELAGILPLQGGEWHEKAVEGLRSYVRIGADQMAPLTAEFHCTRKADQSSPYYRKYLVTLSEPDNPEQSINFHLARRGFARFDPETKHMLKS